MASLAVAAASVAFYLVREEVEANVVSLGSRWLSLINSWVVLYACKGLCA